MMTAGKFNFLKRGTGLGKVAKPSMIAGLTDHQVAIFNQDGVCYGVTSTPTKVTFNILNTDTVPTIFTDKFQIRSADVVLPEVITQALDLLAIARKIIAENVYDETTAEEGDKYRKLDSGMFLPRSAKGTMFTRDNLAVSVEADNFNKAITSETVVINKAFTVTTKTINTIKY